ncbi:HlyD family secretion protein [Anatilimnocola aggregata]|uniref:HlyD family secretion protein n=1 Tax=Anatilimnocola aggregata TaxID=2528021 RepID=A0A517YLT3_9BACT|nr:HlyD family efflux transporter periplasmic adaptor subunit [Anatilimnocola aggregata]QDU31168.1 HlyD family secretion protein [Anatilimnocola aggregata]
MPKEEWGPSALGQAPSSRDFASIMSLAPPQSSSSFPLPKQPVLAGSVAVAQTGGTEGVDPSLLTDTRNEIRQLVNEVAQLAASDATAKEFYEGFLSRVLAAMAAVGGAVWIKQGDGLQLAYHANLPATGLAANQELPAHQGLLRRVAETKQALIVPPHAAGAAGSQAPDNPTQHLLVLAPLMLENETQAVVEVFQRAGGGPTTQRGYLRFLVQMAELAGDFLKTQHLRQLRDRQAVWQQLEQFVLAIHRSLELLPTAYAIVNEGRRIAGCDRVSLILWKQGRCEVLAISGLDSLDRRAVQVKRLAELTRCVLKAREPLLYTHDSRDTPPQIEAALQGYLDQAHARLLGVIPLTIQPAKTDQPVRASELPIIGALIVEQLSDDRPASDLASRVDLVAQHSASALAAVLSHQSVLFLPLWKALGSLGAVASLRALPKTAAVLILLVGVIAALFLVPADFEVAARGKLQPADRREVFAQISGVVDKLAVRHGDFVQAGQPLVELSSHDLEEQLTTILGEQSTVVEQIAATERALLDNRSGQGTRLTAADENRLAAELLELRQRASNLERELALFRQKQQQLLVVAPAAGQVVTWKVEQQLLHRPVERGQALLSLADPAGPWELELYVPERRLKHLAAAQAMKPGKADRQPLEVTFTLASHPGMTFRGQVVEIEHTAQVRGDEGNTILVRVQVDKSQLPDLHDQVTVTGKLYCGERSLGFVWFCDLLETVQSQVLFWL